MNKSILCDMFLKMSNNSEKYIYYINSILCLAFDITNLYVYSEPTI